MDFGELFEDRRSRGGPNERPGCFVVHLDVTTDCVLQISDRFEDAAPDFLRRVMVEKNSSTALSHEAALRKIRPCERIVRVSLKQRGHAMRAFDFVPPSASTRCFQCSTRSVAGRPRRRVTERRIGEAGFPRITDRRMPNVSAAPLQINASP